MPEEKDLCARCRAADNKSLTTMLSCPQCGAEGLWFLWMPAPCHWGFACSQCSMLMWSNQTRGWYQEEAHYQSRREWLRQLTQDFIRGGLRGVELTGTLYVQLRVSE